jgi:hypothetical protein
MTTLGTLAERVDDGDVLDPSLSVSHTCKTTATMAVNTNATAHVQFHRPDAPDKPLGIVSPTTKNLNKLLCKRGKDRRSCSSLDPFPHPHHRGCPDWSGQAVRAGSRLLVGIEGRCQVVGAMAVASLASPCLCADCSVRIGVHIGTDCCSGLA